MSLLVQAYEDLERFATFRLGLAVNAAMSDDPKKALGHILNPPEPIDYSKVPPMLRPAKSDKQKAREAESAAQKK